jgi:hypothetical protein
MKHRHVGCPLSRDVGPTFERFVRIRRRCMDPLGTSRNEQTPLLVLNHCPYRPGEEANNLSSYSPSMVVSAPNDPDHHTPLTRYVSFVLAACVRLLPQPTNYFWLPTTCSTARRSTITSKAFPCCWPQLTDAVPLSLHCLRMSAANRRRQSSPIVL